MIVPVHANDALALALSVNGEVDRIAKLNTVVERPIIHIVNETLAYVEFYEAE